MKHEMPVRGAEALDTWRRYSTVHGYLVGHLSRELTRATGLSEADFQILDALLDAPDGRLRALDLRLLLQWEKSRLSHQVRRMTSRGLLDRQACTEDGRGADIILTSTGREAGIHARRVRERSLQEIVFDTLGPDHLAAIAGVTELLAARLEQAAREDPECQEALNL